jgi:hypothetical protein
MRDVSGFARWWARLVGAVPRAFMRRLSPYPRTSHDGIELITTDRRTTADVDAFFTRTSEALASAASRAPASYADLRKDVAAIILWPQSAPSPYHRYQRAVLAPPDIALEADTASYAASLLYASALARGRSRALARAQAFIGALSPEERSRVRTVLPAGDA